MTLWQVDIYSAPGQPDPAADAIVADGGDLGLADRLAVRTARGYLLEGPLSRADVDRLAGELLADPVVERTVIGPIGCETLQAGPFPAGPCVHVLPKPGVMDPVALSAQEAIADFGIVADAVRTLKKYWLSELAADDLRGAVRQGAGQRRDRAGRSWARCDLQRLDVGEPYRFRLVRVPIRELDDAGSGAAEPRRAAVPESGRNADDSGVLSRDLGRDPTDVELETLAQTWSEHCSHKTLAGRIAYRDERGERHFDNMLKETIFAATQQIRRRLGDDDWCVSVFEDNAGVVRFDEQYNVVFKVETHNHPSALEPYGGANTGIGGVIRDPMGTGLGAKPICNTDVFCFAPPDTPPDQLPARRAASAARDEGRGGRRARLRQPDGHPHGQRRHLLRPPLPGQPAGLLRQRGADPPRQVAQGASAPATGSWPSAGAPAATASTGRRSARPN